MERNFTMANRYNEDSAGNAIDAASLPVQQSPRDGTARYAMSVVVNAAAPLAFTLKASPIAGGPAAGDECGTFTLNQQGQKNLEDNTLSVSDCWNR
jgi:type IV pilus assembly protein PilE